MTLLQVGATFADPDYDEHLARMPGLATCRVFSSTDKLPEWTDTRVQKLKKAGVEPFLSVKGFDPIGFRKRLDTMPADIPTVKVAHHHEPEADGVAAWHTRQRALFEIVATHPNRDRIRFASIQTKQWTENTAGRSYFQFFTGMGDAFAVDCYVNSWGDQTRYPEPRQWLAKVLDFAAQVGQPLWIPELGAVSRAEDLTDGFRADWIAGVVEELEASGLCELVAWWCAAGPSSTSVPGLGTARNFHLNQRQTSAKTYTLDPAPSLKVWQDFMARRRR